MKIYISLCLVLLIPFFSAPTTAQTLSASPYSVYGVGLLKSRTSAYNRSLAGTGIGIRSSYYLNTLNPASYASIQPATQLFEIGFYYEKDLYETTKASSTFSTGNLTSLATWFRFSSRWAGSIGLAPYSTVNYNIISEQSFGTEDDVPVQFTGTGGLTQLYFGNGVRLNKNLSVGLTGSLLFGGFTKNELILSGEASGLGLSNRITSRKLTLDVGTHYSFFLNKDRSLTLGATYTPRVNLNSSRQIAVFEYGGDSLSVNQKNMDDYQLPAEVGAGISFETSRSLLAADLTFKEWSKARISESEHYRNVYRFSMGYDYKGNPKAETYAGIVSFRMGFYLQQNYLLLRSTGFNEWGFSTGAGLPVNDNKGTLNITYHYNQSGTTANSLVAQQAHVITLDLSMRDFWFIRRKFD